MYACIQLKNSISTSEIEITLFYATSNAFHLHEKQQRISCNLSWLKHTFL